MEAVEGDQCPVLEELCLGYNDVGPVGACVGCVRVHARVRVYLSIFPSTNLTLPHISTFKKR